MIGRIVLFIPGESDTDVLTNGVKAGQPLPAIVNHEFDNGVLNMTVFPDYGVPTCKTSVPYSTQETQTYCYKEV